MQVAPWDSTNGTNTSTIAPNDFYTFLKQLLISPLLSYSSEGQTSYPWWDQQANGQTVKPFVETLPTSTVGTAKSDTSSTSNSDYLDLLKQALGNFYSSYSFGGQR